MFTVRGDLTVDLRHHHPPEASAPKLGDDVVVRSAIDRANVAVLQRNLLKAPPVLNRPSARHCRHAELGA